MKYLKQGTLQELCDMAVKAIVAQGGQSLNARGECVPVSECGTMKCAFSHCVDGDTSVGADYHSTSWGVVDAWADRFELSTEEKAVFQELQFFHDCAYSGLRAEKAAELSSLGIDITSKYYQQWVEMGAIT